MTRNTVNVLKIMNLFGKKNCQLVIYQKTVSLKVNVLY